MIFSTNREPETTEFNDVLNKATLCLNHGAAKNSAYFIGRGGTKLEEDVFKALVHSAAKTKFEGSIKWAKGSKAFPDIVANDYFGVEVKSTTGKRWKVTGGSVMESSRIESVKRIFITFGKLTDPVEFRSRPYEDCLYDVGVTHSPRYQIDMELKKGETIFDKMNTTYDALNDSEDPVGQIVRYMKKGLKPGERLWWSGEPAQDEDIDIAPATIRLISAVSKEEKDRFTVEGLAFFPDILRNSPNKYERYMLWLVANHGIVGTRDMFSAGGRVSIVTNKDTYVDVPQVFNKINKNKDTIIELINDAKKDVLQDTWNESEIKNDRIGQWIDYVSSVVELENYDASEVLNSIFNR